MIGRNNVVRHFILNGYSLDAELRGALRGTRDNSHASFVMSSQEILEPFLDQIQLSHRERAKFMAQYYELFFLIENLIRDVVQESLGVDENGDPDVDWWENHVPQIVKDAVKRVQQRERDAGMTPRAREPIYYTTFGELSEIAKANWDVFGQTFNSLKAFESCMSRLNTLRGPIAHCSTLADDEIVRLYVAVRDLFRIMA